jgi:hypothetical protein
VRHLGAGFVPLLFDLSQDRFVTALASEMGLIPRLLHFGDPSDRLDSVLVCGCLP